MSFTLVENDSFFEELAEIGKKGSSEKIPYQQVPADILFYFKITWISHDMLNNLLSTIVTTYFSNVEDLLSRYRVRIMQHLRNGSFDPPPREQPVQIEGERLSGYSWRYTWRYNNRYYDMITVSDIYRKVRPANVPRHHGIDEVYRWPFEF